MLRSMITTTASVAALMAAATSAFAANLIQDGGFEDPASTTAGYQSGYVPYNPGQSFGGPSGNDWTVIGSGNNVALTNTGEYTNGPSYFDAHSGAQWLDLTGSGDNGAAVGVSQTVATTIGRTYDLSLWVGTAPDAESAVYVSQNGVGLGTFANPQAGVYGGQFVDWAQFNTTFVATASSTTLDFVYAGGKSGDGLDDVSLTPVTAVPEPATWAVMLFGVGLIGGVMRAERRRGAASLITA